MNERTGANCEVSKRVKVSGNDDGWFVKRISLRPRRNAAYATSFSFVTKKKAFQTIDANIFDN